MAVLPPSIYFLIGFMDLFMVERVWKKNLNGWRYGVITSILVLLLFPYTFLFFMALHISILIIIIDLFSLAELIALVTPDARRYHGS
jgi:uncharacterized membrane protein